MQTAPKTGLDTVYAGMLGRPAERIATGRSAETVFFGKAVSCTATEDMDELDQTVRRFTSGELFAGVAIADTTLEALPHPTTGQDSAAPYGAFVAGKGIGILKEGSIWVESDTAVDSRAKGVYVKNTDTSGTQAYVNTTLVPAKTAASIATDVMSVGSIATDATTVTVTGFAPVVVTYAGATNTQAEVIADLNAALAGIAVATAVSTTGILLTTLQKGSGITIACTDVAGELEWAAATAGTTPDLDDETITITVPGYAAQTVTFDENAVDIDSVMEQIGRQARGVNLTKLSTTSFRITTDKYGSDQTITVTDVTALLTFNTPVAGTGDVTIYAENARGSFRCYTASQSVSGYTELDAGVARWAKGKTENGKYWGLLELDVRY